ncbi:MAG: recombination protein RecR [Dehalococcoidia bacterium]|nr:recombination protein RecR [Dehalococcoidia bacterium]HCH35347.1 recombination protein RecR [Dehalococcoidia bacterium]
MNNFPSPENTNSSTAPAVSRLIDQFNKLPGVGPKTAQRIAYYLIRMPAQEALDLAEIIGSVKNRIVFCTTCQNIAESDPCNLCANPARDHSRICVVQEPLDVLSLDKIGIFNGLYHVLNGVIDPMSNIGPEDLKISELLERIHHNSPQEIIIATNTTVEGEATAMYLSKLIQPLGPRVTRLARGLPAGGDLEYADDLTLTRAFEGRQDF